MISLDIMAVDFTITRAKPHEVQEIHRYLNCTLRPVTTDAVQMKVSAGAFVARDASGEVIGFANAGSFAVPKISEAAAVDHLDGLKVKRALDILVTGLELSLRQD